MAAMRIVGRVALVALFIFTLVAVALAQENTAQTPAVVVDDQVSANNTVTVRQVTAPQAAFLVIQRDLGGVPGPIIGQVAVPAGTTENVVVPLTEAVAPGNVLYAALYADAGQPGVFEAPGADAPFVLNDQTVAQPFTMAASSDQQAQLEQQAQLPPAATVSPTVALSPTLAVTPTVAVSPTLSLLLSPTVQATPQGQQVQVTPTVQPTAQTLQAQLTPTPQPQPLPATPTTQPTRQEQQAEVTQTAEVQATASAADAQEQDQQQAEPTTPTPAIMPVTGASGTANLPATLLIGALALALLVGGNGLLQRLRSTVEDPVEDPVEDKE